MSHAAQGWWAGRAFLVWALCAIGVASPQRHAAAEEFPPYSVPFPVTGRQTVRANGKNYVIDGKQVIPGGSIIRVEANVRIIGINDASLEVQGGLLVHGTQDCWVRIENVNFSPTVAPDNEMHLDMADMYGCTFVTPEASSFRGGFTIENSALQGGCKFALRIESGFLRIMTVNCKVPCHVESSSEKGTPPEVAIRTSWMQDVSLQGNAHVTLRDSEIRGTLEARNFTELVIDGCDLFGNVALRQGAEGRFSKLEFLKCNLFGGSKVCLDRPTGPTTKMEKVRIARFFFQDAEGRPELSDKQIADRIDDGADKAEVSVKAFWQEPQKRCHFFLSESLKKRRPP